MTIETALDFIRECAGFKTAEISWKYSSSRRIWMRSFKENTKIPPIFAHNNINQILRYAREWCDKTGEGLEIHYSPTQKGFCVNCGAIDDFDENICEAIMRVCVKAERKIRRGS